MNNNTFIGNKSTLVVKPLSDAEKQEMWALWVSVTSNVILCDMDRYRAGRLAAELFPDRYVPTSTPASVWQLDEESVEKEPSNDTPLPLPQQIEVELLLRKPYYDNIETPTYKPKTLGDANLQGWALDL